MEQRTVKEQREHLLEMQKSIQIQEIDQKIDQLFSSQEEQVKKGNNPGPIIIHLDRNEVLPEVWNIYTARGWTFCRTQSGLMMMGT